ncbi:MAG: hypothetical protein HRT72_09360, partial [Flavobacteriales bacterium]|nr:hypothetical protein [Flavobacteriales bacterium]
ILIFFLFVFASHSDAQYRQNYFERGRNALIAKNYTQAIEFFSYSINENQFYQAYFYRGMAKDRLGDIRGAVVDYTYCIRQSPYHKDAYHSRAVARDRLFIYEGAFQDFAQVIAMDSMDYRVYLNRSITHLALKHFKATIKDIDKALSLKAFGENPYLIRGSAYAGLEEYKKAIHDFNKSIQRNTRSTDAHLQRGTCYREMKKLDSAMVDFKWVLDRDSLNPQALFHRGMVKKDQSKLDEAMMDIDKSITLAPQYTIAIFNRAILKSNEKDYQGALADYNEVVKQNPKNILAFYNRAGIKRRIKDLTGSIEDYTKAIELYPEFTDAYRNRADVKKQMSQFKNAEKDLQLAAQISLLQESRNDTLNHKESLKLKKLMSLSGPLPSIKDREGKMQYDHIDVQIKAFYILSSTENSKKSYLLYDAENKKNYSWDLIALSPASTNTNSKKSNEDLDALNQLYDENKTDIIYHLKRANLYTHSGDYEKAIADFNLVLSSDDKNILAYFGRANAKLKFRELQNYSNLENTLTAKNENEEHTISYETILKDYQIVLALDPSFIYAYFNRSYLKSLAGDFNGAVFDLVKVIRLKPHFAEAHFNKGLINLYQNKLTSGCVDLSKAGELGLDEVYNIILRYCRQ